MKFCLLLIAISSIHVTFAQSKHGFETGIDPEALKQGIREKRTWVLSYRNSVQDTLELEIKTFNEKGQIIQFQIVDYVNAYFKKSSVPNKIVYFTYNDAGYLIAERIPSWGPVAIGGPVETKDTIYTEKVEAWRTFDTISLLDGRTIYTVDTNGRLLSQELVQFNYEANNLLVQEEHYFNVPDTYYIKSIFRYTYTSTGLPLTFTKENETSIFYEERYEYDFFD